MYKVTKKGFTLIESVIAFSIISVILAVITSVSITIMNSIAQQEQRYIALNFSKSVFNRAGNIVYSEFYNRIKNDIPNKYQNPENIVLFEPGITISDPLGQKFSGIFSNMSSPIKKLYNPKISIMIMPVPKPGVTDYSNSQSFSNFKVNLKFVITWGAKRLNTFELGTVINDKDLGYTRRVALPAPYVL